MTVVVEICGDPVVGLWCPACLLPSRIALVLAIAGRPRVHTWCEQCGPA